MSATLTYIPNTNIPYAANYIFKVIKYVRKLSIVYYTIINGLFYHSSFYGSLIQVIRSMKVVVLQQLMLLILFSDVFVLLDCHIKTRL